MASSTYTAHHKTAMANTCSLIAAVAHEGYEILDRLGNPDAREIEVLAQLLKRRARDLREEAQQEESRLHASDGEPQPRAR